LPGNLRIFVNASGNIALWSIRCVVLYCSGPIRSCRSQRRQRRSGNNGRSWTNGKSLSLLFPAELSMGPFCVTLSNPTHELTDPTQPNPLQVEKFGPDPMQLTMSLQFSSDVFYTHNLSVSDTGQIGRKIKCNCLVKPNLMQPCFKCINMILCYSGPNRNHVSVRDERGLVGNKYTMLQLMTPL